MHNMQEIIFSVYPIEFTGKNIPNVIFSEYSQSFYFNFNFSNALI